VVTIVAVRYALTRAFELTAGAVQKSERFRDESACNAVGSKFYYSQVPSSF